MTSPTPDQVRNAVARKQIEETYEALDRWRARSRDLEVPQPGSELHEDAKVWPGFPPHQVARVSLISGVQHLNLARAALEHGEGFPIAHPTVLRGALLGAARGVWMLAPDDRHERQQNALRVIHEEHRRMVQYAEHAASVFPEQAPDLDQGIALVRERRDAVRARWEATPDLTAQESPSDTKVIERAARAAFTDPAQQAEVPALWMHLSGAAHGLGWPMLTRPSTQMVPVGRSPGERVRMAEFSSGADLGEIANAFLAGYGMLRRGWSQFDQRCEAP